MKKDISYYPKYDRYALRMDASQVSGFVDGLLNYLDTGLYPPVEHAEGDPQFINHCLYCVGPGKWAYRATVVDRLDRKSQPDNFVLLEITALRGRFSDAHEYTLRIPPSHNFTHRLDSEVIDNIAAGTKVPIEQRPIPIYLPLEQRVSV